MTATAFSIFSRRGSGKPVWRTWASFLSPSTVADIPFLTFTPVHTQMASAAAQVLRQNLNRNLLIERNHKKSSPLPGNASMISNIYFGLTLLSMYVLASFSFLCYQTWRWCSLSISVAPAWQKRMPLWLWSYEIANRWCYRLKPGILGVIKTGTTIYVDADLTCFKFLVKCGETAVNLTMARCPKSLCRSSLQDQRLRKHLSSLLEDSLDKVSISILIIFLTNKSRSEMDIFVKQFF